MDTMHISMLWLDSMHGYYAYIHAGVGQHAWILCIYPRWGWTACMDTMHISMLGLDSMHGYYAYIHAGVGQHAWILCIYSVCICAESECDHTKLGVLVCCFTMPGGG